MGGPSERGQGKGAVNLSTRITGAVLCYMPFGRIGQERGADRDRPPYRDLDDRRPSAAGERARKAWPMAGGEGAIAAARCQMRPPSPSARRAAQASPSGLLPVQDNDWAGGGRGARGASSQLSPARWGALWLPRYHPQDAPRAAMGAPNVAMPRQRRLRPTRSRTVPLAGLCGRWLSGRLPAANTLHYRRPTRCTTVWRPMGL